MTYFYIIIVVVVVVSHIQRIGCQPEKTTLHGGQSRSWSAEHKTLEHSRVLALLQQVDPYPYLVEWGCFGLL